MAFFTETSTDAVKWAKQLHDALAAKNLWRQSMMLRNVEAMRVLGNQHLDAKTVLDWFCRHIGEEFVPRVHNAIEFKKRFEDIKRAMERSLPNEEEEKLDPASQELVDFWTRNAGWPPEIEGSLGTIAQQSMKNWVLFRARIGKQPVSSFPGFVLIAQREFIRFDWMRLLHEKHGWMEHFKGSISNLIFKPDSRLFKESFWRKWSRDYCGKAKHYDSLLEELLK